MAGGRPTKYDKAMVKHVVDYANGGYIACGDAIPSRAGIACEMQVSLNSLKNWEREYPEFLSALAHLDAMQHRVTLSGGISNAMNATICKLVLANHGYSDKVQQDTISSDGTMSPPTRIEIVSPE
jgi:hypothetical protein